VNRLRLIALSLSLVAVSLLPLLARSEATFEYSKMAPLSQYLMDQSAEIALAQTAAPLAISGSATVLVFTPHGYIVGKKGDNGFTCLVERGWMPPFDQKNFWSPQLLTPICYNAPASRTVLLYTFRRTQLALAGLSRLQILARITSMTLPTPEPGSMSYMLSKEQYVGDPVGHWYPHVMFHVPKSYGDSRGAIWGADLDGSPIVFDSSHHLAPEPQAILMVLVPQWSDGTAAPAM
jgi:hypothetical protein